MREEDLAYAGVDIELTRRCNLSCAHCMRGETQNKTVAKNIIDRLCRDLTKVIQFGITGGEPLLELDTLHYLINKVSLIPHVAFLSLTTNGTILNPSVIDDMEKFCLVNDSLLGYRKCKLAISKDPYHEMDCDAAVEYYTDLANKANERISVARGTPTDEPPAITIEVNQNAVNMIQYSGYAKNMVDSNREKYQLGKNLRPRMDTPHRIKIKDGIVKCHISITVDGNVTLDGDGSWDEVDNRSIGNLKTHSLSYLIKNHNEQCLLTCIESLILDSQERLSVATDSEITIEQRFAQTFMLELTQQILSLRQEARQKFELIPTYHIIDAIHTPRNDDEAIAYAGVMAAMNGNKEHKDLPKNLSCGTENESTETRLFANAIDYLRHGGKEFIRNLFEKGMAHLKYLNGIYSFGILMGDSPVDDKCYSCFEEHDGLTIYQD